MFKFFLNAPIVAFTVLFFLCNAHADQRYEVKRGDNLYRIGLKFGIPYQEIMSANRLKNTVIHPSQILLIPGKKAAAPVVAQRSRVQAPPQRPAVPSYSGQAQPRNYREAIEPKDPVQPFVAARPLPTVPPIDSEEDPLGLGYNPNSKSSPPPVRAIPVEEEPIAIARRVPSHTYPRSTVTPVTPREPQIAKAPEFRTFPRSREVPAAAHYPGRPGNSGGQVLDPIQFPTPSFKNPCTPTKKSHSSGSASTKTYIVQNGDSVWSISRQFGVPPLKLRACNNILFSRIRPGMKLEIPKSHGIWSF